MAQAPTILLPTDAYRPLPNQAEAGFAIRYNSPLTGKAELLSSDRRVITFPNYYRALDVLGWLEQHYRPHLEIVARAPQPGDYPCDEWEKLNTGSYQHYSARRRADRLGLVTAG